MPTYQVQQIVDGQPCFEKPLDEILVDLKEGGALQTLTPLEHHTARQRRWYKGVCLKELVANDQNGETAGWWDDEVKRCCRGLDFLKKEIYYFETDSGQKIPVGRLTIVGVGKKNMTNFLEEILSVSMVKGWGISPPDPDLRRQK